jgi:tRNA pseudouridine32 synthase/23S rRNA pseudouridine746 synthase
VNALDFPFPILFRDADVAVIDKPAGLAVHPGPRTPQSLEDHLPALANGRFSPVAAHRLDRDTSGCLAVALSRRGAQVLSAAFAGGAAHKIYWALLSALPAAASGLVDAPLLKISSAAAGWRMIVDPRGKPARTHWAVLDTETRLVEFRPETGRTHQIRVHAAQIGAPIVGDPVYGDGRGAMMLHARELAITLPDGRIIRSQAPLPPGWPPEIGRATGRAIDPAAPGPENR